VQFARIRLSDKTLTPSSTTRRARHENIATTMTSYGTIDPHQQGEVIGAISLEPKGSEDDLLAKIRALVA
jgi:hypothetical protein